MAIDSFGEEMHGGGSDVDTTISRMEIIAAIDALEYLYEHCGPCSIVIYSDSEYLVKGITDRNRKRNKNVDLWDWIDDITDAHYDVEYKHVKGHQGNHYNEMADRFAGDFRLRRKADEDAQNY